MKIGFDNEKYLAMQSEQIKKRIASFGDKLYLEFGGKLFDDYHASRVLPGFEPDSKIRMLLQLANQAEIVIAINSGDIEKSKMRGDLGITYEQDTIRLIDAFKKIGMYVKSVVLTRFMSQPSAISFEKRLKGMGMDVYHHYSIEGYPYDVAHIVSDEGYGKNEYIKTTRPLVVITAPGPGSGKMATCLSQLYHEHKRGVNAGYAKFETFPIWNIALKHPVNMAYEAATAELKDVNMIDPFHLEAYGKTAVNYNRDVEIFPVLKTMFEKIYGTSPYKSPTDMGVNMAGNCIIDDDVVCAAAKDEIIRRYYAAMEDRLKNNKDDSEVLTIEMLMRQVGISTEDRAVCAAAKKKEEQTGAPAAAVMMADSTIITGKTSALLGASSSMLLNALKYLAGIDDDVELISSAFIEPVAELKVRHLGNANPRLHLDEILIALSVCASSDELAKKAMAQLKNLEGLEVHSSVVLSEVDKSVFKKLGMNITCEAKYQSNSLYHK